MEVLGRGMEEEEGRKKEGKGKKQYVNVSIESTWQDV